MLFPAKAYHFIQLNSRLNNSRVNDGQANNSRVNTSLPNKRKNPFTQTTAGNPAAVNKCTVVNV
jgi:hypothetical protein